MKKHNFPNIHIGQRIIKSAVGVFLCYLIFILRGERGIPFYSMLAVLWCIQPYIDKMNTMALQRITGTLTGAFFGLIALLLEIYVFDIYDTVTGFFLNALFIIPVIHTTVLIHKQNASYFSCVVYLSITVNHITDDNPYIFVFNRVLDTFIGIAAGIAVNYARLPRKKAKDCLFVCELDDMLTPIKEELSAYSKVEIKRLTDDGMNFTIATMRTPASLIKTLDGINMKFPVIVMDGAALYDLNENTYITAYVISHESCSEFTGLIRQAGMNCFINTLLDDTLMIFYDKLENDAEKDIFNTMKRSPYRNYINGQPLKSCRTIYIMLIDKTEKIVEFYNKLIGSDYGNKFKILCYPSDDYQGYSYIKIFNKNAGCTNMLNKLEWTGRKISIGTKKEDDIKTDISNFDSIVRTLKKCYEPILFTKK